MNSAKSSKSMRASAQKLKLQDDDYSGLAQNQSIVNENSEVPERNAQLL